MDVGIQPFRYDLVAPDQLGSLLSGTDRPDLWFLDELVACAGKVLARSGNGNLVFVGRSLDSMFDLLSAALPAANRPHRLPISFAREAFGRGRAWRKRPLTRSERDQARGFLAAIGVTPHGLARQTTTFVDVVSVGNTFSDLFHLLDGWADETRQPWPAIRRKLRFVGVTVRRTTSPNAYRWKAYADWTRRLPAGAVVNVSLHGGVWSYFGDHQTKLTHSFRPGDWLTEAPTPPAHDVGARQALAEASAIVAYGRSAEGRRALARSTDGEPALAEAWLRMLVTQLRAAPRARG